MDRREFFKFGASKAIDTVSEAVNNKLSELNINWIRPPFALPENDFIKTCTKCNECLKACPHNILFKLRDSTPAMDLSTKGCHMCDDWPCVIACEPAALLRDAENPEKLPEIAIVTINEVTCLPYSGPECGACAHVCPVPNALTWKNGIKPAIDPELCTGCALCREACIVEPKAINIAVLKH
tara:strand:- start:1055 stop:1600 length:546 start_codon:yes stop_codon:yes gene_type:complete